MATALKKISSKDFFSGLCFLLLGLFLSLRWTWPAVWSPSGPEEAFFPLVAGIIIAVCSLFVMARAIRFNLHNTVERETGEESTVNAVKVCSYILLMALLFGVFFEWVGFLITSAFFLLLTLRVVEKQDWKKTILVGATSTLLAYFLFVYFLGVPLPKGLMKF